MAADSSALEKRLIKKTARDPLADKEGGMEMKTLSTALFFALATSLCAQNVPLGQTLTQDGNSVILMPFGPPSAAILPAPDPVPAYGLTISIAPADVQATTIYVQISFQLNDGEHKTCDIQASVDTTHAFTTTGVTTGIAANTAISAVTSLRLLIGKSIEFGSTSKPYTSCYTQR